MIVYVRFQRKARVQVAHYEKEVSNLSALLRSSQTRCEFLEKSNSTLTGLSPFRHTGQCLYYFPEQCREYRRKNRLQSSFNRRLTDATSLHDLDKELWGKERQSYERLFAQWTAERLEGQQFQSALVEQKQENTSLKETIDRMKWEMDQMSTRLEAIGESDVPKKKNRVRLPLAAEMLKALGRDEESKPADGPAGPCDDMDREEDDVDFR